MAVRMPSSVSPLPPLPVMATAMLTLKGEATRF